MDRWVAEVEEHAPGIPKVKVEPAEGEYCGYMCICRCWWVTGSIWPSRGRWTKVRQRAMLIGITWDSMR